MMKYNSQSKKASKRKCIISIKFTQLKVTIKYTWYYCIISAIIMTTIVIIQYTRIRFLKRLKTDRALKVYLNY